MHHALKWIPPLLAATFLLLASGCEEKKIGMNGWHDPIYDPEIILGADTLYYLPGDSASTTVTVIVTDYSGNVAPGVRVGIALANPQIRILEFLDTELRDTTNDLGRVEMMYYCYGSPGMNIITATAGWRTDADTILSEEGYGDPFPFWVVVTPDSIHFLVLDSVRVSACVADHNHNGIAGATLIVEQASGSYTPPPLTDSYGCTEFSWWPAHDIGWHEITLRFQNQTASDSVWVEP